MRLLELVVLHGFYSAKCFSHQKGCLGHRFASACCLQHLKLEVAFSVEAATTCTNFIVDHLSDDYRQRLEGK
ncbi:hypothetical protein QQP08_006772 [Theobroma cacao]|nr:hypothetical protein QQP08_006395 [Theobroma cacao]WRX14285.1 hypothetical protein QQP08_006772 [Theobroma cacao]